MGNETFFIVAIGIMFCIMLVPLFIVGPLIRLWMMCTMSGAQISLFQLVGMKLCRSPVKHLCELYIMSTQAGLDIKLTQIERAYRAGGDVELVVRAMIKASRTEQNLTWEEALQKTMKDQYDDYVEDNYER
jgi:uncharacterized protein YqfA (UPF0365 family)